MERRNYNKQHTLNDIISEYEAMSQKGTVVFYEETVFTQIIDYYENEGCIDLALAVVDVALEQHLFSAYLYCKKASLLAQQRRATAALEAIQQAEVLAPSDCEVKLIKAEVLSLMGDFSLALSIIREVKSACHIENKTKLAEVFFSEGIIYEQMQEYDSVFHAWKQTLQYNPEHEEALNRIWLCIEMARKFDESIALCHAIIDHDPYCYRAWYNLGHAHTYFGDYDEAIEAYEYAFIINNKFEWAYRHCAELCMEIQDYKKALDCYHDAIAHIQPDGEILFRIGQCYQFLGNTEIAIQFYKRSIKLDELNDEAYYYLGECSAHLQDWKGAIRFYKKAIEIENQREEYFLAIAMVYAHIEQNEKAFLYFDRAIELAPEHSIYWRKFAAFLIKKGALDAALDLLEEASDFAVEAELLYCKAACLFKMDQHKKAMDILAEALSENFELYPELFLYIPELESNRQINSIIEFYRYEA